jgi:capsular exopolysaccharide synthesis family protein
MFIEQYRRLAATLHQAQSEHGIRSVMITSAVAAEGKTLSATNLALTLSGFGRRVLLVDGDLRKPSVHEAFRIENEHGLSDVLTRRDIGLPPRLLSPTLSVMTGGPQPRDPVALLISDALVQFLTRVREQFDWVVVDTPPAVLFPDAGVFAAKSDTCVMVVNTATTAGSVAASAVEAIGASRILGVVLNRAEASDIPAGYDYGRYGYGRNTRRRRFGWRSPRS